MRYALILLIFIVSCHESTTKATLIAVKDFETNHPGKQIMETNCYVCHSPTAGHDDRIGPPMEAIKKHYINNNTIKEEFISAMQAWIKNPNEDDAKMRGAVRRFGVMPKQAFPEEIIEQIADYMYDYELEKPEWFNAHFNDKRGKGARRF